MATRRAKTPAPARPELHSLIEANRLPVRLQALSEINKIAEDLKNLRSERASIERAKQTSFVVVVEPDWYSQEGLVQTEMPKADILAAIDAGIARARAQLRDLGIDPEA